MRFGGAAMLAIAMCAMSSPSEIGAGMAVLPEPRHADPLPSVQRKRTRHGGMNAAQLARLSAKNARRKRRR